jgi:hypothetical protein
MKEDLRVLDNIVGKCKECKFATCEQCEINWKQVQAIENLIKGYKDLEEKNKKQKEHIENINKRNSNQRIQLKLLQQHRFKKYVMSNYIEKSKVREKIEEYEDKLKQPEIQNINTSAYSYYLGKKEGWEELLQEGDDK